MVRIKGKNMVQMHANYANKIPLEDSYRPAGHDSREPQDDNWQPSHADLTTHARGDSYRPDQRSSSLETADSHRPGHSSYHSYRPGQDFYNTRLQVDNYLPGQDLQKQIQADTYRPQYDTTTQYTSSTHPEPSTSFPSQVDSHTFSFGEPVPPPTSPEIAAMDIDMEELSVTASKLTVANEESTKSVVALTRELLVRRLPVEFASLYASEKVPFIPVHKLLRAKRGERKFAHSIQCKNCGKLQPTTVSVKKVRKENPRKTHECAAKALRKFAAVKEAGGWRRVLKDLEAKGWSLGPGPHDEADSERYLGKELFEIARRAGREGKDLILSPTDPCPPSSRPNRRKRERMQDKKVVQDGPVEATMKDDPPSSPKILPWGPPEHVPVARKGKRRAKKAKTPAPSQREKDAESRAMMAIVNTQLGENPSEEERAQARAAILGQSGKQDANNVVRQQALPAFDLRDLGKQLDSLSSATTDDQPPMLT